METYQVLLASITFACRMPTSLCNSSPFRSYRLSGLIFLHVQRPCAGLEYPCLSTYQWELLNLPHSCTSSAKPPRAVTYDGTEHTVAVQRSIAVPTVAATPDSEEDLAPAMAPKAAPCLYCLSPHTHLCLQYMPRSAPHNHQHSTPTPTPQ